MIGMHFGSLGRRAAGVGVVAAAAAAAAVLCTVAAPVRADNLRPFTIGYNQWIGYVGLFAALDRGYFKAVGLDVKPKQFPGPADSVPPLMAGQLDATLTTADTVILLEGRSPVPLKNVYVIDTSNGADGVVAQPSIKTVRDLRGQTVAATIGQCNELLLLKALAAAGMTEQDVKIVNMDADAAGAAVVAGKVPAAVSWEPWLTNAQKKGAHIIFTSHDAPNTLLDTVAATGATMTGRSADLRAFLSAYAKGTAYALAHPADAQRLAARYLGVSTADAKTMLNKVKLYTAADNVHLMGSPSRPGPATAAAKQIAAFFVSQKQLKTLPNTSGVFTAAYLPK